MRYEIRSDIRFRRVLDEGVLLRQEEGEIMGLNLVGIRIVELLKEGLADHEIVTTLGEEFEAGAGTLQADVADFLNELVALGVIEPADESRADGV